MIPPSSLDVAEAKYWVFSVPPDKLSAVSYDRGLRPASSVSRSNGWPGVYPGVPKYGLVAFARKYLAALAPKAATASVESRKIRWPNLFEIAKTPNFCDTLNCGPPTWPRFVLITTTPLDAFCP